LFALFGAIGIRRAPPDFGVSRRRLKQEVALARRVPADGRIPAAGARPGAAAEIDRFVLNYERIARPRLRAPPVRTRRVAERGEQRAPLRVAERDVPAIDPGDPGQPSENLE
jgi:hypothetical protein